MPRKARAGAAIQMLVPLASSILAEKPGWYA